MARAAMQLASSPLMTTRRLEVLDSSGGSTCIVAPLTAARMALMVLPASPMTAPTWSLFVSSMSMRKPSPPPRG